MTPPGTVAQRPEAVVQRQLDAYNARDLDAFVAEYAEDVEVFRPPAAAAVLTGRAALAEHYRDHRFNRPGLHARLVHRIVTGHTVFDHEQVWGLAEQPVDAVVVFQVSGGRIRRVWMFASD